MKSGDIPFIGSTSMNNGVTQYINTNRISLHTRNTITINYNGSVGEAFYQPVPFFASDDVNVLYPKFLLNTYISMFLITIIHQEKYRFSYGRKWKLDRMKQSEIKLPATSEGKPDWKYMEEFIKSLPYSSSL